MIHKDFKDYADLITILKQRKLIIKDEQKAIDFLRSVHYYRLSAYFIPFQHPKNSVNKDIFFDGTSFEDIISLYHFDKELRQLVFNELEYIEISLRAKISHIHSKNYNPFAYIRDTNSLNRTLRTKQGKILFNDFMEQVSKEKVRANEAFIKHIKEKYHIDDLPLWALVEILSFGTLLKMLKLMHPNDKMQIMKAYELNRIHFSLFEDWLKALSSIRNICAHHARLWNREFGLAFKYPKKLPHFLNPNISNKKLFFALSIIAFINKNSSLKAQITKLLSKYPQIYKAQMGFVEKWQSLYPWSEL